VFSRLRRKFRIRRYNNKGSMPWLGGDLFFPRDSIIALNILRSGGWESEIVDLLKVGARDSTTVFDVGANVGAIALQVLNHFKSVSVISFEPSPSILPHLRKTHEASRFKSRWHIREKAVTDSAGQTLSFHVQIGPGWDAYEGLIDTGRGGQTKTVQVETVTIDHEWRMLGKPEVSLIKVDVEGAEVGVLRGAEECVHHCKPTIVTEWCDRNFKSYGQKGAELFTWARGIGYEAYAIPELYPIDPHSGALEYQLATHENFLLVPARAGG
jgi:FkbM family methyltransferase